MARRQKICRQLVQINVSTSRVARARVPRCEPWECGIPACSATHMCLHMVVFFIPAALNALQLPAVPFLQTLEASSFVLDMVYSAVCSKQQIGLVG
jgi:hypothetical protein